MALLISRRGDVEAHERALSQVLTTESTYAEELSSDFHRVHVSDVIGSGRATFEAAAESLLSWTMYRKAGLGILASSPRVEVGADVVVAIRFGPVQLMAPCRVDRVVDEPARAEFSYLTLPGHPECGRETFSVRLDDSGAVSASIDAISKPGNPLVAVAGPLARHLQMRAARRYLEALRTAGAVAE